MLKTAEASVKVFISSVIAGLGEYRAAAREAAENLGYSVVTAEDVGASPDRPQQVCLAGVREADVIVLLLGQRYGSPQASGLSPTRGVPRGPGDEAGAGVRQTGVTPELDEAGFIEEVGSWEGGQYRESFGTAASLRAGDSCPAPVGTEPAGRVRRRGGASGGASALLPQSPAWAPGSPQLHVVTVGGPLQQVQRPSALDDPALQQAMEQEALYGARPVLDRTRECSRASTGRRFSSASRTPRSS